MIADDAALTRLMALSLGGDRMAYTTLLKECERWLKRFYARRVPPCNLEDLVQETLMSLHRKRASYDPARPFLPWLAAIARYRWVDHLRKVYRANESELDEDVTADPQAHPVAARVSIERLLALLPAKQSKVIELVKIDGLSIAEAAAATGQTESLVKVNIHRGLKKLTGIIEKA